jgi:ribosome maturation factor RimP
MNLALEKALIPTLAALGLELVSIKQGAESGRKTLRICIDKPSGITVDDCSLANRQINAILEVDFPEMSSHDLEVSSPGLNRELIKPEHYKRFIGNNIKISLHTAIDGQKHFKGRLLNATDVQITFESDDKTLDIMLENIDKANLIPELRF